MSRCVLALLLLTLLSLSRNGYTQPGTYIHYTSADGLSSRTLYDALQDRQGFVWISANTGVYRFDGSSFRHFSTEDGVPDNEVLNVNQDHYGRIWFSCFNSKIGFYQNGRFYHPGNHPVLAGIPFRNIVLSFYEGTDHTLHIRDLSQGYIQVRADGRQLQSARIMPGASALYWERGQHRYGFAGSEVQRDGRPFAEVPGGRISMYSQALGPVFYCETQEGLYVFRDDSFRLAYRWPRPLATPLRFTVEADGRLFLLGSDLVEELAPGADGRFVPIARYPDVRSASEVFRDRDGGTWITSLTDGLYYYPPGKRTFRTAAPAPSWPGKIITELQTCGPWLIAGFENGNVARFGKELDCRDTLLVHRHGRYSPVRHLFYEAASGRLLASGEIAVHTWTLDDSGRLSRSFSLDRTGLKGCVPDGAGNYYFSSATELYRLRLPQGQLDSLAGGRTRNYAVCPGTAPDRLWYSNTGGLQLMEGGRSRPLNGSPPYLRSRRIISINRIAPDRLLLVSDHDGIAITDTSGNVLYALLRPALHNGLIAKVRIQGDTLWLAGEAGIGAYRIMDRQLVPLLWLDHNNGLLADDVYALCPDGRYLYAATAAGLQKLDLRMLPGRVAGPRLFVHSIADGGSLRRNPGPQVQLPAACRQIRLECSALAFGNTAPAIFSYRFEDAANFIETASPMFAIPISFEGSRRLYIRCRKGSGEWSAVTVLELHIPVPVYRRPVALVLFFVLLLGVAVLLSTRFAGRIRRRQLRDRDLRLQVASLEMRALQAMMNPHFVFNALNAVQHYLNEHDTYQANKYLVKFSRLIRSSLNSSREPLILLSREIDYITNYLDLEQLRFSERLRYTIALEPGLDATRWLIPGQLLQPLVENAVIHGVMRAERPVHITVSCGITEGQLLIRICDDGPGLTPTPPRPEQHRSLGLEMIRNRLRLLSEIRGQAFRFSLTDNRSAGTGYGATALLELPLIPGA